LLAGLGSSTARSSLEAKEEETLTQNNALARRHTRTRTPIPVELLCLK
jgi:hypothetical protein